MNVSNEVLVVLSGLDIAGPNARIIGQLDRKMYSKVNAVLEALGGKWSRKVKAHVFSGDPQEKIDRVITTGTVETAADLGWFASPPELARALVAKAGVKHGDRVLEPSAGEGAIAFAIQDAGGMVTAGEIDEGRRESLLLRVLKARDNLIDQRDFIHYRPGPRTRFDCVVMNPPFCKVGDGDHLDHVRHAYSMLRPGGVLVSVLPSSVAFRSDRRYSEFRSWVTDLGAIESLPPGSFKASGTNVNTCVIRICK